MSVLTTTSEVLTTSTHILATAMDVSKANAYCWLDGSDSSTISISGGLVTQRLDKSGNARHFSQATVGDRPTYDAAKKAIYFPTRQSLDAAFGMFGPPVEIYCMYELVNPGGVDALRHTVIGQTGNTTVTTATFSHFITNNNLRRNFLDSVTGLTGVLNLGSNPGGSGWIRNKKMITRGSVSGTTASGDLWIDGVLTYSGTAANVNTSWVSSPWKVGAYTAGDKINNYAGCYVYEVVMFDRILNSQDRQDLVNSFIIKYGS